MFQKHITLAVVLTLAAFSVFAQTSLRETLKKHHFPITPGVERGLQLIEKHEVKNTAAGRGTAIQLDSILRFYSYFDADSTIGSRDYFFYPHPDTMLVQLDVYNNGLWVPQYHSVFATSGLYFTQVDSKWDEVLEDYIPETLIELNYHNAAKIVYDSLRFYGWNGSDWEENVFVKNDFDANDRISRTYISFMGISIISIFTYDAAGNILETNEIAELLPGFAVPIGKTVYVYQQNRLTEKIDYSIEEQGKPPLETGKTTYEYDAKDNVIQEDEYDWNAQDTSWALINSYQRVFDTDKRLISEIHELLGADTSKTRTDFSYFVEDKVSLNASYQWDELDQKWFLDQRSYYYYSGSVRTVEPLAIADLNAFPNPVFGWLYLKIPADATVTVRDINGKMIHSGNAAAIDFAKYSSGTFMVSAFYGKQWHYAKIVKLNDR